MNSPARSTSSRSITNSSTSIRSQRSKRAASLFVPGGARFERRDLIEVDEFVIERDDVDLAGEFIE